MALPSVSEIPLKMTVQLASFTRGENGFKEIVVISSIVFSAISGDTHAVINPNQFLFLYF